MASALYAEPLLTRHLATPRAYISLSVHGLPALLGGIAGVLLAAVSEEKAGLLTYSISLYTLYPARAPPAGWTCVVNKTIEQILLCPTSGTYCAIRDALKKRHIEGSLKKNISL